MRTIEEIEIGQNYWTCEPVIESSGYGEICVRPWQGKVSDICLDYNKTKRNGRFKLSYFYKKTEFGHIEGECDKDSNATALCEVNNIFESEKEAWNYYLDFMIKEKERIQHEINLSTEILIKN